MTKDRKSPAYKARRRELYEESVSEITECKMCGESFDGTHYWFDAPYKFARSKLCKKCASLKLGAYPPGSAGKRRKNRKSNAKRAEKIKSGDPVAIRRQAVLNITKNALAAGLLIKPGGCERCGQVCNPHGHHKTLCADLTIETLFDIEWLCPECHTNEHRE